jgi:hypothetical protein
MCNRCPIQIKVVNKYHGHKPDGDRKIDIMRGTPLGNPYRIGTYGDRDTCIKAFEAWLNSQIIRYNQEILDALNDIAEKATSGGVDLVCCCAPHPCHGEIIKQVVLQALITRAGLAKLQENHNA